MGDMEDRLRRLERRLLWQPSAEEYLDASSRARTRSLHTLAERLEKYGFDGGYLFNEHSLRMLAEDTPERRERDRETIEAWRRAHEIDPEMEAEGAKERLLARLEARDDK